MSRRTSSWSTHRAAWPIQYQRDRDRGHIFERPSRDPLPEPDFEDVKHPWPGDLESRLRELEEHVKGFRFDNLGQNPEFVSVTLQATQAALQTHLKGKREALRNALLNAALCKGPDPNRQQQFLVLVDPMGGPVGKTTTHLGEDFLAFITEPDCGDSKD